MAQQASSPVEGAFTVGEQAGDRLDRALLEIIPDCSRTSAQRLIEAGRVLVNGRRERAAYRVETGDVIRWECAPSPERAASPAAEDIPLEIVFEDEDILVVNKPKGLVVHPAPGHHSGTLVNAVLGHTGDELAEAGAHERPGIVHRLDRDTSGLMVVAKSQTALRSLQHQIQAREVERRYLAVVRGAPRFERATVDAPIGRDPGDRKRMAVINPGSPHTHREALTGLRTLERFAGCALLEARLETGRTHQIRVHCAYIGLPVLGDATYGPSRTARDHRVGPLIKQAIDGLEGQALHAYHLAFQHPRSGERLRFQCAPPGDMQRLLDALGSTWSPANGEG